jgi:hypothetical protein
MHNFACGGVTVSKYRYQSLLCPSEKVTEEQLQTERRTLEFDHSIGSLNRRGFLGVFAASVAAAVMAGGKEAIAQTAAPAITDVLNFALNLEYLEASLYLSVSGGTLSATDMGASPGTVSGAPGKLTLSANSTAIAAALATDEVHHIELLRQTITTLGATPISMPNINLGAKGQITTEALFLATARQFTAVGGSAYAGAAQYLIGNTTVLTAAAQILGAEGQHAGGLAYCCDYAGMTPVVSPPVDAMDVPPSTTNYFTVASGTALSPIRTTSQVLGIVYGVSTSATTTPPTGTTSGGFFPNGFNGNIKST